jgi:S1-C subfamily serine protease
MCRANQVTGILHLGRKPDLSIVSPAKRDAIQAVCPPKPLIAEQFACQRKRLAAAGLPVRDEPGGGPLHAPASLGATAALMIPEIARDGRDHEMPPQRATPLVTLSQWRTERPAMPGPFTGPVLSPDALHQLVAPSVYVVLASDHAIELAERVPRSQGGAVAITDRILVTNCHVVEGRPEILLSQQGHANRAHLLYADPGGDRCFLQSDTRVHPVPGLRRLSDLKIGEKVFSLGAPHGVEGTFGTGDISAFRQREGVRMIQSSVPAASGSSGGGLFDARGNLIGITTAGRTIGPTLTFSIAADDFWP